jgi:hypothetical protein
MRAGLRISFLHRIANIRRREVRGWKDDAIPPSPTEGAGL